MEATLRRSVPVFVLSSPRVRTPAAAAAAFCFHASQFSQTSLEKLSFRCRKNRRNARHSLKFMDRRVSITCGGSGVAEINEGQFVDKVLKSNRLVLVEFVANWCGPCRLISPAIESLAQEYGDRLTVVKIDHDLNPKLIEEYKVYGLPTLIFFKNGQEVPESRREGAITKVKLREYVNALLESISVT